MNSILGQQGKKLTPIFKIFCKFFPQKSFSGFFFLDLLQSKGQGLLIGSTEEISKHTLQLKIASGA